MAKQHDDHSHPDENPKRKPGETPPHHEEPSDVVDLGALDFLMAEDAGASEIMGKPPTNITIRPTTDPKTDTLGRRDAPPITPPAGIPNMSLDHPSDVLLAEPVAESGPESVVDLPFSGVHAVPDDEVDLGAHIPQAHPASSSSSNIFTAESISDHHQESDVLEAKPLSGIISGVVEALPLSGISSGAIEALPISDMVEAAPFAEATSDVVSAEPISAVHEATPISEVHEAEAFAEATSDVAAAEPISAVHEATPISEVHEVEAFAEVTSDVVSAEPISAVHEANPISDVHEVEAFAEATSDVAAAEPISAVHEATPISDVHEVEAFVEATSDVVSAEPISAVHEATPISDVHEVEAFAEATSDVTAAEPISSVHEAQPISKGESISEMMSRLMSGKPILESSTSEAPTAKVFEAIPVKQAEPSAPIFQAMPIEEPSGIFEGEEVAEASSDIHEAQPLSAIESGVMEAEPVSDVASAVEAISEMNSVEPIKPDSEHILTSENLQSIGSSAVLGTPPLPISKSPSDVNLIKDQVDSAIDSPIGMAASPVSDVIEAEELSGSSAIEAEAFSGVEALSATGSNVASPVSDVLEAEAVEGSSIISAEHVSDVVEAAPLSANDLLADEVPLSTVESGLVLAEVEEPSGSKAKVDSGIVIDDLEEAAAVLDDSGVHKKAPRQAKGPGKAPSSATVNWDDIEAPPSSASIRADLEKTSAYDPTLGGSEDALEFASKSDDSSAVDLGADAVGSSVIGMSAVSAVEETEEAEPISALSDASDNIQIDDLLDDSGSAAPMLKDIPAGTRTKRGRAHAADAEEGFGQSVDDAEPLLAEDELDAEPEAVAVAEDDEAELVGAGVGAGTKAKKEAPAKRGGGCLSMIGGGLLSLLLVGGALGGVWFFAPSMIENLIPREKKLVSPLTTQNLVSPLQKATEASAKGDYQSAIDQLNKAELSDAEYATRGQARWLKYIETHKDAKLDKNDPEVKLALDDLNKAKRPILVDQVTKTLDAVKLQDDVAKFKDTEKVMGELQTILKKDLKGDDLSKAVSELITNSVEKEKVVTGIAQALLEGKYIEDKDKLDVKGFEEILKKLSDQKAGLEMVNKLLEDAKLKDVGVKGVEELLTTRKDIDDKLTEVNKLLDEAKVKEAGPKGVIELVEMRTKLEKERDDLNSVVKAAVEDLTDAKVLPGADLRKVLPSATREAKLKTESPLAVPLMQLGSALSNITTGTSQLLESAIDMGRLTTKLGFYQMREQLNPSPEQRLDSYLATLENRTVLDAKELETIMSEMNWILSKESGAEAISRAKAHYINGLILRNQEKYEEARQGFTQALAEAKGPIANRVQQSLTQLTNPGAYYLPRIEQKQALGKTLEALQETELALKAIPENGTILLARAQIRLDTGRTRGLSNEATQQIRADAELARKDDKAGAAFILGELEQTLGNFDSAEKLYREAIENSQADPRRSTRYRIALARLLTRNRNAGAPVEPAPAEPKVADKVGQAPVYVHPLMQLVLVASITAEPNADDEEDPLTAKRLEESIKLAEELIQSEDPKVQGQGMMIKGLAISKQGNRTDGLRLFAKGLLQASPDDASKDLNQLLSEHPAFMQQDTTRDPNPPLAMKHFGKGLNDYWDHRYDSAEQQFRQAITFDNQDARFHYFLGLSLLVQPGKLKRDAAIYAIEQGSQLETRGQPTVDQVNASLERIQGDTRNMLNRYRYKTPVVGAAR